MAAEQIPVHDDSALAAAAERVGDVAVLDRVAAIYRRLGDLAPKPLLELLQGRQLGHALHPLLVTVPIGAWVSAAVLDVVPGRKRAARTLVGLGALLFAPAAWTGIADWQKVDERGPQRIGVAHGGTNALAATFAGASWLARRSGRHGLGRALLVGTLGAVSVAGYLGGHLTYRHGAGVEHPPAGPAA